MGDNSEKLYWWPIAITAALSFLAVLDWPYSYYTLLRFVFTCSSIYYAYQANHLGRTGWMWIFIFSAILFNPILPIHLNREAWTPINIVLPIVLIIGFIKLRSRKIS